MKTNPLRWLRFTLRELFLVGMIFGIFLCWYRERGISEPIHRAADLYFSAPPNLRAVSSSCGYGYYRGLRITVTASLPTENDKPGESPYIDKPAEG